MTFDPKYGYTRIENKSFTLGGQAAPAPRDSDGGDENAAARRTRDRDYLFSRFGWFWDRRAEIFNTPEIYGIYPLFSGLSLAYVGGGPLSLGMLFYLWRTSQWLAECPECGSTALIYFAGGSPLSGMNRWAAHCIFCGANVAGSAEKFHELWRPATIRAEGGKAARGLPRDIAPLAQGLRRKKRSGARTGGARARRKERGRTAARARKRTEKLRSVRADPRRAPDRNG